MKKNIIIVLALLCIGLSFAAITSYYNTKSSEPMLKITTSTQVGFYFSNTNYYIIYENGIVKKTDKFVPTDVINYYFIDKDYGAAAKELYDLDINTPQGEELKEIANNILLLMDKTKLKIISVSELYILGDRYFFDVLSSKGKKASSNKLFEYIPADNSVKEIADFNSKSITHVELCESYEEKHSTVQNAESVKFEDLNVLLGDEKIIKPEFTPVTVTAARSDLVYTYDKGSIIKIDEHGVIQAISAGTVTVTGTTKYGVSASFTVTVTDPAFTKSEN